MLLLQSLVRPTRSRIVLKPSILVDTISLANRDCNVLDTMMPESKIPGIAREVVNAVRSKKTLPHAFVGAAYNIGTDLVEVSGDAAPLLRACHREIM